MVRKRLCRRSRLRKRNKTKYREENDMTSNKRAEHQGGEALAGKMVSRRTFVTAAAAGTAGLLVTPASRAVAETADVIKIGFISPRSGPLGSFGESDPY